MSNKHITNPCPMGGQEAPEEGETTYYILPNTSTTRLVCPLCDNLVSINKGNRLIRSHNAE